MLSYLKEAKITIPLTYLAQFSPYFRDKAKRLMLQPRNRKVKGQPQFQATVEDALELAANVVEANHITTKIKQSIKRQTIQNKGYKAFSIIVTVQTKGKNDTTDLPRNIVAVD